MPQQVGLPGQFAGAPFGAAHEVAGELWLQVHRYEDARRFFARAVERQGKTPRLALGRFASIARLVGDPRLGVAGAFLSLHRVVPNLYPLTREVEWYIADEQRVGRLLDYAVIAPRLQRLYEWSAGELGERRLLGLVRDGSPIYAWAYEQRHVWQAQRVPLVAVLLERVTRAR